MKVRQGGKICFSSESPVMGGDMVFPGTVGNPKMLRAAGESGEVRLGRQAL